MGDAFLDMSQYKTLFGTTRIPNKKFDILRYGNSTSKHILVVKNGHVCNIKIFQKCVVNFCG